MSHRILVAAGLLGALVLIARPEAGQAAPQQRERDSGRQTVSLRQVAWDEARALVARFEPALPSDLRDVPSSERPVRWSAWVASRQAAIAARVVQGEDDSLVNLLLFGTSFTREPRVTPAFLARLEREEQGKGSSHAQDALLRVYTQRASDLVAALARSHDDERLRLARATLVRRGLRVTTAAERARTEAALLADVVRVREEAAAIGQALERASRLDDPDAALAERSRVFRDRGLAPDTTVLTQYAVDRALDAIARGDILEGAVRRVAIVGPGLDFADKQEGYDFYPPQSLQPFAVLDSLARAGLGRLDTLQVTTFDVSPRVNDHLRAAVERATRERAAYRLVLPLDSDAGWKDEAVAYWKVMASPLGSPFDPIVPPDLPHVRARGVAVDPSHLARLRILDGNIVFQRADLPEDARFDLVIATNVLLYYDVFEQSLAFSSLAALLRPGGVLLSNTALLEVPEIPMRSAGYATVPYSDRPGDGERVILYTRTAN